MKPAFLAFVTVILLAIGSTVLIGADGPRQREPYPKATPPPPASPVYHDVRERIPGEADIEREASAHVDHHLAALESALTRGDRAARDVQFLYVLPELIQVAPERVDGLLATLKRGEARDTLRVEMTRQLVMADVDSAIRWIGSLEDESEKSDSARIAVRELAPLYPAAADRVAELLGLGGNEVVRAPAG